MKKVDQAVFLAVKEKVAGTLKGGENPSFGIKEDAVGLAPYHDWETKLPADVKAAVDKAKADVIAGTVTVPTAPPAQ